MVYKINFDKYDDEKINETKEEEKNIKEKEEENMINIGSLQENNKIIPKSNIKPLNMAANQQEENNIVENNKESEKENK